jgi:ABC-2 type transport system permease protein
MKVGRTVSAAVFITLSYLKNPLAFLSDLIIPLVIFMVVQLGTGKGVESLLGILVAVSWSSGSFALAKKLALYRMWRLLDMFVVSPLKPVEFAIATALAHLLILAIPAGIVTAIIMAMSRANPTLLLLTVVSIVVIAWLMGTLFGLYIYGKLADPLRISGAANLLNLLLILLPPVMYPASILPTAIQLASAAIPTVSLKLVALHLMGVGTDVPLLVPAFTVVAHIAVFLALALRQRVTE